MRSRPSTTLAGPWSVTAVADPEASPRDRGQVAPGGLSGRAEPGDEHRSAPGSRHDPLGSCSSNLWRSSAWHRIGRTWEPVSGIESLTCRLQEVRPGTVNALAAQIARPIALLAPAGLGLLKPPCHEPCHGERQIRPSGASQHYPGRQLNHGRRITRSPGPLSGRATCTDRLTRAPDCSQRTARTIFRATTRATTRPALSNRALLARVALAPRSAGEALVSFS